MSLKIMKKIIGLQKTLKEEKNALGGLDFSIAKKFKKILERLEETNNLIIKATKLKLKDTLVDLLDEKTILQSQLKDWDQAGRPIDKKGFQIFLQGYSLHPCLEILQVLRISLKKPGHPLHQKMHLIDCLPILNLRTFPRMVHHP